MKFFLEGQIPSVSRPYVTIPHPNPMNLITTLVAVNEKPFSTHHLLMYAYVSPTVFVDLVDKSMKNGQIVFYVYSF